MKQDYSYYYQPDYYSVIVFIREAWSDKLHQKLGNNNILGKFLLIVGISVKNLIWKYDKINTK